MRKILFRLAMLVFATQLFSQTTRSIGDRNYWGFEAGLNYTWYQIPTGGFFFRVPYPYSAFGNTVDLSFNDLGSGLGFQLGVTGDMNLASRLSLGGKLMFRQHSTTGSQQETGSCPNDNGTQGTATVRRNFDATYSYFGGDLLLRFQIDPNAWYLFGGIGIASMLSNSVSLRADIISSDNNDCQYTTDDFSRTPMGTAMPIYQNQKLTNFFNSTYAGPKFGAGTFIPIGDNGLMLTPELAISIPLNEWIETDNQINAAKQPKLWYASLTVGLKFPWGDNTQRRTTGVAEAILAGHVRDRATSAPIEDAKVTIIDLATNEEVDDQSTDETGAYGIQLYPGHYSVTAEAEGYIFNSTYIEIDKSNKIVRGNPDIYLSKPPTKIRLLVFFDFNQSELKPESYPELKRAIKFMKDNPDMGVEIAGHTDNVGSDQYNKDLSQKRANMVMDYLADHGIDRRRLTAIGYGESQPIDSNDNDDGRANNRRVEFIVKRL